MNSISSGCYVIDSDYNIISANDTAKDIYPQLEVGKKCYSCLMGLDAPCGPCPVVNKVKGPRVYTDPIRGISESVDAVELNVPNHGKCHALVFSTVGELESFAATLPHSALELKNLALIKALTADYLDVFSVDLSNHEIEFYRHDANAISADSKFSQLLPYEDELTKYVEKYVHEDDKNRILYECSLSNIKNELRDKEFMTIHYKVIVNEEIRYIYRRIVRAGSAASFSHIIVGIASEDEIVLSKQRERILEQNLSEVEIDSLTGLYTKEAFIIHGQELLSKFPEKEFDFCVLKLYNFDLITHQYGYAAGERLLSLIGKHLKEYDNETTCLSYFGEGIFASFTENYDADLRQKTVMHFKDIIIQDSPIKNIAPKWAIYQTPRHDLSVSHIIENTFFALTTIKDSRNKEYISFSQNMVDMMEWEKNVENTFESALENNEFVAWYQPIYSVKTKEIISAEALVRWITPDGHIIQPARFIPILEQLGKIHQLDTYIFKKVCEFQARLQETGINDLPISVNYSRAGMFNESVALNYANIVKSYGVSAKNIPIEITESAAVRSADIKSYAAELMKYGFCLHMDDFGSGYSSMASLQIIPFKGIKIDKSLVDFIGTDNTESLLRHTISFAKECGMKVIAEGVENYEQYLFLKYAGCDAVQGFYFSKPVDENTFLNMMQE